jgi:oligoribonuclease
MRATDSNLVWLDLEMTGLEPQQDRILEIATIITNNHLDIIAEGPVFAIHQSDEALANMNEWCVKLHGSTGLTARCKASLTSEAEAEALTVEFMKKYVKAGESPLCGNSVHQDRRFLYRYMPQLAEFFHYRNLDVSTLKILAQRWAPKVYAGLDKESTHTALQDIRDSIEELRYYRKHLLKSDFYA